MDGEGHQKKSGLKGKRAKRKFARTVKSGVNQKVSQTPQDDGFPSLQVDEDAENPILERVASITSARKYTKSELKVALKRAK
jgi:hypothetical protein